MKEQLISFKTAKLAKENGFNLNDYLLISDEVLGFKSNYNPKASQCWFLDITQSLLQKWLRDIHLLEIHIEPAWDSLAKTKRLYAPWVCYTKEEEALGLEKEEPKFFDTYEEALESALVEALNLIKA